MTDPQKQRPWRRFREDLKDEEVELVEVRVSLWLK